MKKREMTLWQTFALESLWLSARIFASLPHWFQYYVVENILFFFLYYLLRYRMKVVKQNLRASFPEKSPMELLVIRRRFYRTLSELFVDTVNMAGMTPEKARRVMSIENLEQHLKQVQGRDWIALAAHFGCWEYNSLWGYFSDQVVVAVYHPLRSVVMERFYQRLRNNPYSMTVAMTESLRFYLRNRETGIDGKNLVMGLIADQNPPRRPDSHWFRFLNQDTLFFDGGEKLALRCSLPVYFLKAKRLYRGCYRLSFEQIYDGQEPITPNEITERYVRRLETMICEHPELWMWSHRRWKHKR